MKHHITISITSSICGLGKGALIDHLAELLQPVCDRNDVELSRTNEISRAKGQYFISLVGESENLSKVVWKFTHQI